MFHALVVAKQKLREYYEKTYRDHGFLYRTGTLLAPQYKLSAFDDTEYSRCHDHTSKLYCEYLRTSFQQYRQQIPEISFRAARSSCPQQTSELDRLLVPSDLSEFNTGVDLDEVDRYLRESKEPQSIPCSAISNKIQEPSKSRPGLTGKNTNVNIRCPHD